VSKILKYFYTVESVRLSKPRHSSRSSGGESFPRVEAYLYVNLEMSTGLDMIGATVMLLEGSVGVEAEVAQLRRGDLEALSALLARYQNRLYRYLLRLVREPATAEDLFQQTWLRVAEKINKYDARWSFDAWLFIVARNLAFDHLRRIAPESLDEPAPGSPSDAARVTRLRSTEPPAIETILAHERTQRLSAAMGDMQVIYREVLTLRFEEEMKLEEISKVLDQPLSTVKTRLRRGLDGLRQILQARYPGEDWQ
jgi:RNA polymerase sigma-70 factor, ECF subfamily